MEKVDLTSPGYAALKRCAKRAGGINALARKLGLPKGHLSRLLRGERRVTMDLARKFHATLGIPLGHWT